MIVAAAIIPTAPLLVPGVTLRLPDGFAAIAAAAIATLRALPPHDLAILVTAADDVGGVHIGARASLAGIGRPDLRVIATVDRDAAAALAVASAQPLVGEKQLPLGAAVLVHLYAAARDGDGTPVVPVAVSPTARADALQSIGAGIAATMPGRRAVAIVAGDLSAGLTQRAPLALVEGARAWDEGVVDVVASGRIGRVTRFGPEEACRVGAVGWAPLVVLHGVCEQARLGTVLRRYAAPRGVGYLVASAG